MASSRIVYQNWIADLGHDPDRLRRISGRRPFPAPAGAEGENWLSTDSEGDDQKAGERTEMIRNLVGAAVEKLGENEREFVERYYFMGQSYAEIAGKSGRAIHRLEALHQRALRKLRRELSPSVAKLFGIAQATAPVCPICCSPDRNAIERIIAERDPTATWRPVMTRIRKEFGLVITTPQTLIGHEKYH